MEQSNNTKNKTPGWGPFIPRTYIRKRTFITSYIQKRQVHSSELHISPIITAEKTTEYIRKRTLIIPLIQKRHVHKHELHKSPIPIEIEENTVRRRNNSPNLSLREKRYSRIKKIRLELASLNQFLAIPSISVNDSDSGSSDPSRDENVTRENFSITTFLDESKDEFDILEDNEWLRKSTHVFVLSFSGKPIYSLQGHGNEDKMGSLFALIHCFVETGQVREDNIISIEAEGIKFVFIVRDALYLVAASRNNAYNSVPQLISMLSEVYNQIVFLLTYPRLEEIFSKAPNYDLRNQLVGTEKLFYSLIINKKISNNTLAFLTDSVQVLPLAEDIRSGIVNVIKKKCSKIKNLVFALLIADRKLIAFVRMKNYSLLSSDMRLLFNFIENLENTIKNCTLWMPPVCLPNFDREGFLYAYVSYISKECNAFLVLLSVDPNMFSLFARAHRNITKGLQSRNYFTAINIQQQSWLNLNFIGIKGLRHFIYKPKSLQQVFCSEIYAPYTTESSFMHFKSLYYDLHNRMHNKSFLLKFICEKKENEIAVACVAKNFECYALFDPFVEKTSVVGCIAKLNRWIKKGIDVFFIRNFPTI